MSTASVRIDLGTRVGPYVVERRLAQGGMSVLFLAHDEALERPAVLKVIPDDLVTSVSRTRLVREARALAAVDHPGVVRVYGVGEHEGTPWIAMEYARGTDLKRLLADRGVVSSPRALRWIAQAAEALAAAHGAGVIHRDLKPSNVLITYDDQVKIVDFGIAKRRVEPPTAGDVVTSKKEVMGTPAYLSPEQLEHGLADERSDVWALGCVLYELVVGQPPFGRVGNASTMAAILRDEPAVPETVSPATRAIIVACLRKSSFARVGSASELAAMARDALEAFTSGEAPMDRLSERLRTAASSAGLPEVTGVSTGSLSIDPGGSGSSHPTSRTSSPPRQSAPPPGTPSAGIPSVPPPGMAGVHLSSLSPASSGIRKSVPPVSGATTRTSVPPAAGVPARGSFRPTHPSSSNLRAAVPPPHGLSPLRAAGRGRIKGTAIRAGLAWFAAHYGQEGVGELVRRASPELRSMLRTDDPTFGFIASGWYDAMSVGELLELMVLYAAPEDEDEYTEQLTTAIARDNVSGIYRSLFRLITTASLLEANAQRIWQTYCDEGTLGASSARPGELTLTLKGIFHHHAKLCRTIGFSMQNVLRQVGFTGLVLERVQCVGEGHGQCVFEGLYLP